MAEKFLSTLLSAEPHDLTTPQDCCICLEELDLTALDNAVNARPVRLPCTHIVHINCIAKWLLPTTDSDNNTPKNTCPLCRHSLFSLPHALPVAAIAPASASASAPLSASRPTPTTVTLSPSRPWRSEVAAVAELRAFFGTNQLLHRSINGFPNLYDEGQTFNERLEPRNWQLDDRRTYEELRWNIPPSDVPPQNTRQAYTRMVRDIIEISTYRHLRREDPSLPRLTSNRDLDTYNIEAYYTTLDRMGVFDRIWGPRPRRGEGRELVGRRSMFQLMRDSGYAYQWRRGSEYNFFRRVGWRRPGRDRDVRVLSQAARGMLAREPLPSLEALMIERGEIMPPRDRRRDGAMGVSRRDGGSGRDLARVQGRGDGRELGRAVRDVMEGGREREPSSTRRRMMQWAERHWLRGFALG